ncbi:MAG: hypothetical protein L6V93_09020 [Clostridiales bacterium]|nr:MAG: hypothetical protein L6V93_09020 [Clostridiales bacterium]
MLGVPDGDTAEFEKHNKKSFARTELLLKPRKKRYVLAKTLGLASGKFQSTERGFRVYAERGRRHFHSVRQKQAVR